MPSHITHVYAVLTFGHLTLKDPSEVLRLCSEWIKHQLPKRFIIITETGKSNSNFHVNLVFELFNAKRTDHLRKSIHTNVYARIWANYQSTRNDVLVRNVTDHNTLIGGYLNKEDDPRIIENNGYDISECKKLTVLRPQHITLDKGLTDLTAVPEIIGFAEANELSLVTTHDVSKCLKSMVSHGYTVSKILPKLGYIALAVLERVQTDLTTDLEDYFDSLISRQITFLNV